MDLINALSYKTKENIYPADKENNPHTEVRELFAKLVSEKRDEVFSKILSGNEEQSFQTGAGSYTETEWRKLLMEVDAAQDNLRDVYKEKHPDDIDKKNHFYNGKWYSSIELAVLWKKESEILFSDSSAKNECVFDSVEYNTEQE
ncbi:MAG TPA: hypothetical protein DCZ23_00355 [Lachnospiraceae bacterium]|nr:hypothetical protein [Lachnospiraceae bacterium]